MSIFSSIPLPLPSLSPLININQCWGRTLQDKLPRPCLEPSSSSALGFPGGRKHVALYRDQEETYIHFHALLFFLPWHYYCNCICSEGYFELQSCLILVINVLNSWGFGERTCQLPSENYHSVADSVLGTKTCLHPVTWGWRQPLLLFFPAFLQYTEALLRVLCQWRVGRSSPPWITEKDKDVARKHIEQSVNLAFHWSLHRLHSAMSWLLGLLAGRTRRPCPAGRPGGDARLVLPCILPHSPKHSPHQFSAVEAGRFIYGKDIIESLWHAQP